MGLDEMLEYLSTGTSCPLCVVALDIDTGKAVKANSTFVRHFGPLYKFAQYEFALAATDDEEGSTSTDTTEDEKGGNGDGDGSRKDGTEQNDASLNGQDANTDSSNNDNKSSSMRRFRSAIDAVRRGDVPSSKVRNVEMLTLAGHAGLPIKRHFDWNIGVGPSSSPSSGNEDGDRQHQNRVVLLYGDPCSPEDEKNRARDAELIDFFQNAPIALHWLSGEGIVLWSNQTELNVLGYAAEEYIGQPIMKFCPDEEELVLEIFKQLGGGNTIRDVPVRFRTKDGRIVHLLIDSNVAYNKDGSFGHTRCFIRDDTQRKIRDARSALLLEEIRRSLRMLDNFMSRILHHVRGPLHSLQITCDLVADRIRHRVLRTTMKKDEDELKEEAEDVSLLERAGDDIAATVRMIGDVSDLARFDQGATLRLRPDMVSLKEVGMQALAATANPSENTQVILALEGGDGGGPASIRTDRTVLMRILSCLMENAVRETSKGRVTLRIGYHRHRGVGARRVTFEVEDTGPGLPVLMSHENILKDESTKNGKSGGDNESSRPAIFQAYHNGLVPTEDGSSSGMSLDYAQAIRSKIEEDINSHRRNGVGIGLPLSYHLVSALGGDLRYESVTGEGTRFWFTLPIDVDKQQQQQQQREGDNHVDDIYMMDCTDNAGSGSVLETESILKDISITSSAMNTLGDFLDNPTLQLNVDSVGIEDPCSKKLCEAASGSSISAVERKKKRRREEDTQSGFTEVDDITERSTAASCIAEKGVKAMMQPSILVVEDSDVCAKVLCMQLRKFNCATSRAENGEVALEMLKEAVPGMYNMVLMDLRMPVMDGLEATRKIREDLGLVDLPVIALTGEVGDNTREECDKIGFHDFFAKPLKRDALKVLLKKYAGYEVPSTSNAKAA